jgi:hypothetical protein
MSSSMPGKFSVKLTHAIGAYQEKETRLGSF